MQRIKIGEYLKLHLHDYVYIYMCSGKILERSTKDKWERQSKKRCKIKSSDVNIILGKEFRERKKWEWNIGIIFVRLKKWIR